MNARCPTNKTDGKLHLSKIGDVKIKLHRPIEGKVKTCTIVAKNGKYDACFSCEVDGTPLPTHDRHVGIDLGVKHLLITSDGDFYNHPKYLRKSEKKLRRLQRAVARKRKDSRRRRKAVRRLANCHEHVANQRRDYAHKVARELVNRYGTIVFEDLQTANLLKNHHLAKSIADASWHQLVQCTTYKTEEAGRCVVLVDPKHTSQHCSKCNKIVPKTLQERTHRCPRCGYIQDRDVNAAENVLNCGLMKSKLSG